MHKYESKNVSICLVEDFLNKKLNRDHANNVLLKTEKTKNTEISVMMKNKLHDRNNGNVLVTGKGGGKSDIH